jgi:hypothetical protein
LWVRELADGARVAGLFNRTTEAVTVELAWEKLGGGKLSRARDLWVRQDLNAGKEFAVEIPAHGCVLLRVE